MAEPKATAASTAHMFSTPNMATPITSNRVFWRALYFQ
jgi:hypothetical protein